LPKRGKKGVGARLKAGHGYVRFVETGRAGNRRAAQKSAFLVELLREIAFCKMSPCATSNEPCNAGGTTKCLAKTDRAASLGL
jgi:hypothetical protein